jgi:hypothetical protein
LAKYHAYLERTHPKGQGTFILCLLTLDGREPSELSLGGLPASRVLLLSYRDHIAAWLNRCVDEVPEVVRIRESVQQYLEVVLDLCGERAGDEMSKELGRLILEGQNIDLVEQLGKARGEILVQLEAGFWKEVDSGLRSLLEDIKEGGSSTAIDPTIFRRFQGAKDATPRGFVSNTTGVEFLVRHLADGRSVSVGVERQGSRIFVVARVYRDGLLLWDVARDPSIPGRDELPGLAQQGFVFKSPGPKEPNIGWFRVTEGPFQPGGLTNVGAFLKDRSLEAYARALVMDRVAPVVRVLQATT